MKKLIIWGLCSFLAVAAVNAQDEKEAKPRKHFKGHHAAGMMKGIELTESQKAQAKTIRADYQKQMQALKSKEDQLTVKVWKEEMQKLHKDQREKMQNLLTADQKAKIKEQRKAQAEKMKAKMKDRGEKMKKELQLTETQSAKLKEIHEGTRAKMKSVRENNALTEDQKKEKVKSLMQEQRTAVKSVLTPEQQEKMKQKKGEHRFKGKKHAPRSSDGSETK